jgi:dTDP-4-dehydrorhamnose reductase
MKIMTVGATGYLGSEIFAQAAAMGHEALGTSRSDVRPDLVQFDLDNTATWPGLTDAQPDALIWTAWSRDEQSPGKLADLLDTLGDTKFIYVSSDAAFCNRSLRAATQLGDYARTKRAEQSLVLQNSRSAVFVTGPIYGETGSGRLDSRTVALLERDGEHKYWDNAYKTFVPVRGLARTILANLDKSGQYFVGPRTRQSYFDFYKSQVQKYDLSTTTFRAVSVANQELGRLGICGDTSYADNPTRLWSE